MASLIVLPDAERLARAAAETITAQLTDILSTRDRATLGLTGGRTPRRLYELLADRQSPWRARIEWSRLQFVWGDERHVPPDDPTSNYRLARETLLADVPVASEQIHRIRGEFPDAAAAAAAYAPAVQAPIDLLLLGIGEDGHIASVFPGSVLLERGAGPGEVDPPVAAVWVAHLHAWRITLTPSVILAARHIVVLASGDAKANALRAALEEADDVNRWPAQLLREAGDRVTWLVDEAAAARLSPGGRRA